MKFKTLFRFLVWISLIGLALASILPHLFTMFWVLDVFAHFKLQYLFVSLVAIPLCLRLKAQRQLALVVAFILVIWNAWFIAPLYVSTSETSNAKLDAKHLKVLTINLLSSNQEFEQVNAYINKVNPDLLVLMELTPQWSNELAPILNRFKTKKSVVRRDNFGIGVYSKLNAYVSIDYFDSTTPSLVLKSTSQKQAFTLVATHPFPPMNQQMFIERNKRFGQINKEFGSTKSLVVVGDFNCSSFSSHFNRLLGTNLKDTRKGFGVLPTWPSGFLPLQTTLDHCLVSKEISVVNRITGPNIGSDHLPVVIELIL